MKLKLFLYFAFSILTSETFATTWDEPWQDKVIKEADSFVFAKVKSFDPKKGVTIEIIKSIGGQALQGEIKIENFHLLDLCSGSGEGGEFHFDKINECYFLIKKNKKGQYCIATPTTGFDYLKGGNVYATYRHSYHQALVPVDIYEKTMTAIFNNYHGMPYDKQFINEYINKYLSLKPAGFEDGEIKTFFAQHVALECIYHLRLEGFCAQVIPFLGDTSNFHTQVSAARALVSCNTVECKLALMKVISDTTRSHFVQVICLWTLAGFKPAELKEQLIKVEKTASTKSNGFGGDIMDPRVCTSLPDVKEAIEKLVNTL